MRAEAVILKDVFPYLRSRRVFIKRTIYAAVACWLVLTAGMSAGSQNPQTLAAAGSRVFDTIIWLVLVAGLLECIIGGGAAIAYERERNTVALWVVAGMEHVGMVVWKFIAVLARVSSTLVAPLVPAAMAVFMGGRSLTDVQGAFLAVISLLVLSAAISVAVSARQHKAAGSVPIAAMAALGLVVAPWGVLAFWASLGWIGSNVAAGLASLHPFTIIAALGQQKGAGFLAQAYLSVVISFAVSFALLVAAGLRLKAFEEEETEEPSVSSRPLVAADRALKRLWPFVYRLLKRPGGIVEANPVRWREGIALLNMKGLMGRMTVTDKLFLAAAGGAVVVFQPTASSAMGTIHLYLAAVYGCMGTILALYYMAFAMRAAQSFSAEFESGQMDLIRITRLTGSEIVSGKLRAYLSHYSPLLFLSLVWAGCALFVALRQLPQASNRFASSFALILTWPTGWPVMGLSVVAMALLSSLYYKSSVRALYATAALAFLAPLATRLVGLPFSLMMLGLPIEIRLAIKLVLGAGVFMALYMWVRNYDRSKLYSKQECLVLAAFTAGFMPRLLGPLLGAVGVYLVVKRLMISEFPGFMKDQPLLLLNEWNQPVLTWNAPRVHNLTHLGIAPSIQRRLGGAETPGRAAGAAPARRTENSR